MKQNYQEKDKRFLCWPTLFFLKSFKNCLPTWIHKQTLEHPRNFPLLLREISGIGQCRNENKEFPEIIWNLTSSTFLFFFSKIELGGVFFSLRNSQCRYCWNLKFVTTKTAIPFLLQPNPNKPNQLPLFSSCIGSYIWWGLLGFICKISSSTYFESYVVPR